MKRHKGLALAVAALLLLPAGCGRAGGSESAPATTAGSTSIPAAGSPEPAELETTPEGYGALVYVDTDEAFLREGLALPWDERMEAFLAGVPYTETLLAQVRTSGIAGYRLYEMDGYLLNVLLFSSFESGEIYPSVVFPVLTGPEYALALGLHTGMGREEVSAFFADGPLLDTNIAVNARWDVYPEGLFEGYEECLVYLYQFHDDTPAQALCMYFAGGTLAAITAPYWAAG